MKFIQILGNKKAYIVVVVIIVLVAVVVLAKKEKKPENPGESSNLINTSLTETNKLKEQVINKFLVNKNEKGYFRSEKSTFKCASKIIWSETLSETEEVTATYSSCLSVVEKDGIKTEESGFTGRQLFTLKKVNNIWAVSDYDSRQFPGEKTTKEWVISAEKKIPVISDDKMNEYTKELKKEIFE